MKSRFMIKKVYVQIATPKQAGFVRGAENVTLAIVSKQRGNIDSNNFIMLLSNRHRKKRITAVFELWKIRVEL